MVRLFQRFSLQLGCLLISTNLLASTLSSSIPTVPYPGLKFSKEEALRIQQAHQRLKKAIQNPEYELEHWINLPSAPQKGLHKTLRLTLREAILLALRYNSNIQNVELDRITQRYQLRLAQNEFELQYALAGTTVFEKSRYSGQPSTITRSYMATPEFNLKSKWGTEASLKMDNTLVSVGSYSPLMTFSMTQPLLRGFGKAANQAALQDAIEAEALNKLATEQSIMDQVTQVIGAYRAMISSSNTFKNQRWQLNEAYKTYAINEKKIDAGQLEPTANVQQSYQIESLKLMVEQAENDFKTSAQNLLETIGLDPEMKLAVPSDVTLEALVIPNVDQSTQQALAHNTEYLHIKSALRADERAYHVAKNQQLWQLDVGAHVQAGTISNIETTTNGIQNIYNGRNVNESVGVTMTIPFHDITRRNQLITAKIRLEKDRLQLIAAKRSIITAVKNIIASIRSQARQYELANRQVAFAEQSYSLEKKKQQAGISSALDVNNTQNQLIQAQMSLINSKIAYLNQLSALQRLLGTTLSDWKIKLRYS